ncbi:hypothetical protein OPIT5_24095 [Opitutaceae bacterium TAV5]|nr:hypothetical protein OPIT5_24095 [Opitutaceae bacterium TAV5]
MKISRSLFFLLAGLLALIVTAGGWMLMFSTFRPYDDEGCLLYPLRNFVEHGGLYGDIFSFYGPVYSLFYYALNILGVPLTNTAGRWVTWILWLGASGCTAGLAWRMTRGRWWGLVAMVVTPLLLQSVITEPIHMVSLMALIMACMAWAGWEALEQGRGVTWAVVCGAGAAMLLLVKINIGIFAVFSMGAVWWQYHADTRVRRVAPWLLSVLVAGLIWGLMGVAIERPWVAMYGAAFVLAALPLTWAPRLAEGNAIAGTAGERTELACTAVLTGPSRVLMWAAVAAATVIVSTTAIVMAKGTPLSGMMDCLVFEARKFSSIMSLPFSWPPQLVVSGVCSGGLLVFGALLNRAGRRQAADVVVVALRLMTAMALMGAAVLIPAGELPAALMPFAVTWVWIFVWPLGVEAGGRAVAGAWLCWFALGQWLHSFAVAGSSQMALSSFLMIPVVLAGVSESVLWLRTRGILAGIFSRTVRGGAFLTLVAGLFWMAGRFEMTGTQYLDDRHPLNLPGAENLRLSDEDTLRYRVFATNVAAHADILYSLPQLMSYNLWSGVPGATWNSGVLWYTDNDHPLKTQTLKALKEHPRSMLIVEDNVLESGYRSQAIRHDDPLYLYLKDNYVPVITMGRYSLRVRKGRIVTPLLVAQLGHAMPGDKRSLAGEAHPLILRMMIPMYADRRLASVDIVRIDQSRAPLRSLGAEVGRITVTPMGLEGDPLGPAQEVKLPLSAQGAMLIEMVLEDDPGRFTGEPLMVVLRDPDGIEIGLAFLNCEQL